MIEVKVIDDQFVIKGSFALGIAGTYVNEAFGSSQIQILDTYEEVIEDYTEEHYKWHVLETYLKDKELNEETVSWAIGEYYNAVEKKVQECIRQINSNFLVNVFSNMVDCGNAFWEIEGAYIEEKMPKCQEEDYSEVIYEPYWREMEALYDEYDDTPNNHTLEKTDVEARLREMFPMFNMDALIQGVSPEYLTLDGNKFSFQCSDSWDNQVMCGAYDQLDEDFTFTDWHNF
ncbi:MAG: hypothetical protein J6F30_04430 [Cellulosilyticum sp.]|nr:hypothetical protein [Cellulosilyticum sp.]